MAANTKTRALIDEACALPPDQQRLLVEAVSLSLNSRAFKLTKAQIAELKRRAEYYDEHPDELIPGEVALENARAALKKHRDAKK